MITSQKALLIIFIAPVVIKVELKSKAIVGLRIEKSLSFETEPTLQDVRKWMDAISPTGGGELYSSRTRAEVDYAAQADENVQYYYVPNLTPPASPEREHNLEPVPTFIRSNTHQLLIKGVMDNGVISVRGPPGIGKTTLASQLIRYAPYFDSVHTLNLANWQQESTTLESFFSSERIPYLSDLIALKRPILLVIDEAQKTHFLPLKHTLWGTCKQLQDQAIRDQHHLKIIMFGVYGENPSGGSNPPSARPSESIMNQTDPAIIGDIQMPYATSPMSLQRYGTEILLLSEEEYHSVIVRYNKYTRGMKLGAPETSYIWKFLGGHIGLIAQLLKDLHKTKEAKHADVNGKLIHIATEGVARLLAYRSVPNMKWSALTTADHDLLNFMFRNGGNIDSTNALKFADSISRLLAAYFIGASSTGYSFGSPFVHYHLLHQASRLTEGSAKSLTYLMQNAIRGISHDHLKSNTCRGDDGRIYEEAFKMMVYHNILKYLGPGEACDAEVGRHFDCDGKVDLYVRPYGWAIELLRNSDGIAEHLERFKPQGTYYPMQATDYIVVNFVQVQGTKLERKIQKPDERLWTIFWSAEVSSHMMLFRGLESQAEQICLEKAGYELLPFQPI